MSRLVSPLTVAAVPTGIKTGVVTSPCAVWITPRRALLRLLVFSNSKGFTFTKPKLQIFFWNFYGSYRPYGLQDDNECYRFQNDCSLYDFSSFGLRLRGVKCRKAFLPVCVGSTRWLAERVFSILFSPRGLNCPVKRLWSIAIGAPNFLMVIWEIYIKNFFRLLCCLLCYMQKRCQHVKLANLNEKRHFDF